MRRRMIAGAVMISSIVPWPGAAQPPIDERTPVAWASCGRQEAPELAWVTDVNAQSANGRLAVGFSREGRVSVFRWPRPSFYDQVKYFAFDPARPHQGALANEGLFFGLALTTSGATRTSWLDASDWNVTQAFRTPGSDTVVTSYEPRDSSLGLTVEVTDVVETGSDVLRRRVQVERAAGSPVTGADLVAFENFNLVVSKQPLLPTHDQCQEDQNVDAAQYLAAPDAIVHAKQALDVSTGEGSSVAIAMGFAGSSAGHQVGGDAYESTAVPDGKLAGPTQDAYDDAADGILQGSDLYAGQTTGALLTPLLGSSGSEAEGELIVAAAPDSAAALASLAGARATPFQDALVAKEGELADLLADAPLPNATDSAVLGLAKRALITALTVYDEGSGAVVASIATQGPYGEDWIRDGAFINHALDIAGFPDLVRKHNLFYTEIQSKPDRPPRGAPPGFVPPGNWNMMYYADGVVAGPIPWEIDETAFGVWTMWDHYTFTGDEGYLGEVWPSIKLAADFLVLCRDPSNGLQCVAVEDDNPVPGQTLHGAGTVWLALDSAAKAATELGKAADAAVYRARADELKAAIESRLWNGSNFGGGSGAGGWLIWPVEFLDYSDWRIQAQADYVWADLAPSFLAPTGGRTAGAYEAKGLIALGKIWAGRTDKLALVRSGLEWIAHEQATPGTGILGESWQVRDGKVVTKISQPHVWEQILFYLASLEAYGRAP